MPRSITSSDHKKSTQRNQWWTVARYLWKNIRKLTRNKDGRANHKRASIHRNLRMLLPMSVRLRCKTDGNFTVFLDHYPKADCVPRGKNKPRSTDKKQMNEIMLKKRFQKQRYCGSLWKKDWKIDFRHLSAKVQRKEWSLASDVNDKKSLEEGLKSDLTDNN